MEESHELPQLRPNGRARARPAREMLHADPNTHTDHRTRQIDHDLRWYHIIAITVSGVIGAGLYVRSGAMLEIGGPAAVLIPYLILGFIAWSIMQCIGEMLVIWPVSNALVLFVKTFVDEELGTVVGWIYWLAYAIGFSGLITAAASEATVWSCSKGLEGLLLGVPMLLLPLFNCLGVKAYGWSEVGGAIVKLSFIVVVFASMIAINRGAGVGSEVIGGKYWKDFFAYDSTELPNWGVALFVALHIGAFSFIGIEIPAITALEAKLDVEDDNSSMSPSEGNTSSDTPANATTWDNKKQRPANAALLFACSSLPVAIGILYLILGIEATFNVDRSNPGLPKQISSNGGASYSAQCKRTTSSVFVISAEQSGIPGLRDAYTAFFLVTAWTSANTSLYVSSRVLYGMTEPLNRKRVDREQGFLYRWCWYALRWMGRTSLNHFGKMVPMHALFVSALVVSPIPFLQLARVTSTTETILVLTEMGSVCCLMVWAFECLAYIRLRHALKKHEQRINGDRDLTFLRLFQSPRDTASMASDIEKYPYPWKSHLQPLTAWVGFLGPLAIVVVAGGSSLWPGWRGDAEWRFLAAYLPPSLFIISFLSLKVKNNRFGRAWDDWFPLRNFTTEFDTGFKERLIPLNQNRDKRLNIRRDEH